MKASGPPEELPRPPHMPPRRPQEAPRRPPGPPKRVQEGPRPPQEAPKTAQDGPKARPRRPQDRTQIDQNRAKKPKVRTGPPGNPQDPPGPHQDTPKSWIWDPFRQHFCTRDLTFSSCPRTPADLNLLPPDTKKRRTNLQDDLQKLARRRFRKRVGGCPEGHAIPIGDRYRKSKQR